MATSLASGVTLKCLICRENGQDSLGEEDGILKLQEFVIYLVNKLLEIPVDVCANYLANFGSPETWISICDDCSLLVGEGRKIFNQIQQLEQRHKAIGEELKLKMEVKPCRDENGEGHVDLGPAATEIRNYLGMLDNYPDTVSDEEPNSLNFDNLETDNLDGDEDLSKVNEINDFLQVEFKLEDPLEDAPENVITPNSEIQENKRKVEHISENVNVHIGPSPKRACKMFDDEEEAVELKIEQIDQEQNDPLSLSLIDFDENSSDSSEAEIEAPKSRRRKRSTSTKKVYKKKTKVAKSNSKNLKSKPEKLSYSQPEPPNGGKCEECGEQYYTCMSLEIHMRDKHLDPEELKCSGCSASYRMISSYNDHALIMGTVDPSSPCALSAFICTSKACGRRWSVGSVLRSSQAALDLHQKIHHANERPPIFRCIPCQLLFRDNEQLALHLESEQHRDKLKFACPAPGCSKAYASHTSWQQHIWSCHETTSKQMTTDTESMVQNQRELVKLKNWANQIDVDNQEGGDAVELVSMATRTRYGSKLVINNEIRQQKDCFSQHKCPKCGIEKPDQASGPKEQELKCKACSMTPSRDVDINIQTQIADKMRYHCKVCRMPHARKVDLNSHMRTEHDQPEFYSQAFQFV